MIQAFLISAIGMGGVFFVLTLLIQVIHLLQHTGDNTEAVAVALAYVRSKQQGEK